MLTDGIELGSLLIYSSSEPPFTLPDISNLNGTMLLVPLKIYSADGNLIAIFGGQRSEPQNYAAIPRPVINAFVSGTGQELFSAPGLRPQPHTLLLLDAHQYKHDIEKFGLGLTPLRVALSYATESLT